MNEWANLSDTEVIFLVLAAMYLWECSCWLRGDAICFTSALHHHYPLRSLVPIQNQTGRLVFTNPLPFATSFVCQPWPVPLDPQGLLIAEPSGTPKALGDPDCWISYQVVRSIEKRDRSVLVNGKIVASLTSDAHAAFVVARLRTVWQAAPNDRERTITALVDEIMDVKAIAGLLSAFHRVTFWLRISCTVFWAYGLIAGPLLYCVGWFTWWRSVWVYLAGFFVCWLVLLTRYYRVRRAIYVENWNARLWHLVMALLSPGSAMRAAETVSRDILACFHPLAVAAVICSRKHLVPFAEQTLREILYPAPSSCLPGHSAAGHAQAWFRDQVATGAQRVVRNAGLDPLALLSAPSRSPDAMSFCPRCLNQYVMRHGFCDDCGGVVLQSFGEATAGSD